MTLTPNAAAPPYPSARPVDSSMGIFELDNLPIGTFDIVISAPGFVRKVISHAKLRRGVTWDLGLIELQKGYSVKGRVRTSQGAAMPNATVRITQFYYNREYPSEILTGLARGDHVSTSDNSGNYEISGLTTEFGQPPSKLFAFAGGLATGPQDAPDRTSTIDLVLKPTGTLSGTIGHLLKPGDTRPVVIAVSSADVNIQLVAVVEEDGTFGLHDVPVGDYQVQLFGETSQIRNVTVDQDKDTVVKF